MELQEKLGIDEVIDTLADALGIVEQIHTAVKDGIQITDAVVLFQIAPAAAEIRRDWETFKAQVADMDSFEADDVAAGLQARLGSSDDKIVNVALDALQLAAEWYAYVEDGVDLGKRTIAFGKDIFQKDQPEPIAA